MDRAQALRIAARQELNRRRSKPATEKLYKALTKYAAKPGDGVLRAATEKLAKELPVLTTSEVAGLDRFGTVAATVCQIMPRRGADSTCYLIALEEAARDDRAPVDSGARPT